MVEGSIPSDDQHNSVYISLTEICRQQEVSHVYLTIYRNRKLFIGSKQYHTYDSGFTLAQEGAYIANNESSLNGQAIDDAPSRCMRQIALPRRSPVLSGTVLNNGETVSQLSNANIMTVLRFDITNILSPLHGRFRVTWWDTQRSEWSTEDQCETTTERSMIVARCQHLTDFTLIVLPTTGVSPHISLPQRLFASAH
ncbi:hypothetical protein KIN20_016371 [Parelaphostrongylus tenuis]|uniref:GPS domain-containing protein n=1 Tax=Parelaphostrongylus tenuis TaxID=148309 RepID=A0AAD5N571_PARTN|nr:hypothetical protein KIN20_016371 [Parelaphostrongylus tenuis]